MFPFDLLTPVINKVLDYIPDPKAKAEALAKAQTEMLAHEDKIMAAIAEQNKSQADINIEEAKSTNWFIAGWRPFIGWTCGVAFAWSFVVQPILIFILFVLGRPIPSLPVIAVGEMMPVLTGMLGLAGLRTYEKKTDSESKR